MTDITETPKNMAFYSVPTRKERFWRAMGFRYHLGDEPEGMEALTGWVQTNMHMTFSWTDRFRLLLTGRLRIVSTVQMDTPSPEKALSRMDWMIYAPGERRGG
jgi:hypothetical protein